MRSNNKTSLLVSSQLPEFVRDEHQTFVSFLEYYYKFLEQDGQLSYVTKNFPYYLDIDIIKDDIETDDKLGPAHQIREEGDYHGFLQKMYDTYIKYIPDAIIADKALIVKHAKEFYRSTGSEKSVRFLIQALFNKQAEFYYPQTDVLKASDGKWFIEKSLKVTNVQVNNVSNSIAVFNFGNTSIKGLTSNATAIVEKVDSYYDKGSVIYELKLSTIYKEFLNNEKIATFYTEEGVDKYLTANLFSGIINSVQIVKAGTGYTEGTTVPIVSGAGSGAQIIISRVSKGTIQAAGVVKTGAGFRANDALLIYGSGSGATGIVDTVDNSGFYHPNSYNVVWSTISLEANTAINNVKYSNLVSSISDPANAWISNSMSYFVYANCGPAYSLQITSGGSNYVPPITMNVSANSIISKMGILGKMQIVNGGLGYTAGDRIEFLNVPGSAGSGAIANVTSVEANGMIKTVKFEQMKGHFIGGQGYNWFSLPSANVVSGTGSGANIAVTAIIGHNEEIIQSVSDIGAIQGLTIVSGGSGYSDDPALLPYLDLSKLGDGKANARLFVVTGVYSYPGRYVTDDGLLSSYNFLEDRDYYQNFTYVVRVDETINKYRYPIKNLIHPAGMRMYGQYITTFDAETQTNTNVTVTYANTETIELPHRTMYQVQGYTSGVAAPDISVGYANAELVIGSYAVNTSNHLATYSAQSNNIIIHYESHGFIPNSYVFLQFVGSNTWANLGNSNYVVTDSNVGYFKVHNSLTENLVRSNTGTVRVWNPDVVVNLPHSLPSVGDNVYFQFKTLDISLTNTFYQIIGTGLSTCNVLHPNMTTANDAANVANIITKKIVVTANNHGYSPYDQTYILFLNGDSGPTKNAHNGYYTVTSVKDSNTFNVVSQNTIFSGTTSRVYKKGSQIVIPSHPLANANAVYIAFTGGDQGNTVNGVYYPVKTGSDTFTISYSRPVTSNSNVRVWYQTNNYSNIRFTALQTNSGFASTDNVCIEFYTSSTDLSNGIYMIKNTYGSNTYNIYYDANISIVNAYSTYGSQVRIPAIMNTTNILSPTVIYRTNTINAASHSGLGIVANSVMEGIAYVSPYK